MSLFRQKFRLTPEQEWITTGGFLLAYIALGSSAYQLPHYIFVVFPLAAIVTAKLLRDMIEGGKHARFFRIMQRAHIVITFLLLSAVLLLVGYVFNAGTIVIIAWAVCMAAWLYYAFSKNLKGKLFWLPAAGMIVVNIFLTNFFYHTLLHYQAGSQAGRYIRSNNIDPKDVGIFKVDDPLNSVQFYANGTIKGVDTLTQLQQTKYLLTMDAGLESLKRNGYSYTIMFSGDSYKVSELTLPFLNPNTRGSETKKYYIVKVK